MNAATENNTAKQLFLDKIYKDFNRPKFKGLIVDGSIALPNNRRAYRVKIKRMDNVMNSICHAIYFTRYKRPLSKVDFRIGHTYCNLVSDDSGWNNDRRNSAKWVNQLFDTFSEMIDNQDAGELDEHVYSYRIAEPGGPDASITLFHRFYGTFDVISWLTRKGVMSESW